MTLVKVHHFFLKNRLTPPKFNDWNLEIMVKPRSVHLQISRAGKLFPVNHALNFNCVKRLTWKNGWLRMEVQHPPKVTPFSIEVANSVLYSHSWLLTLKSCAFDLQNMFIKINRFNRFLQFLFASVPKLTSTIILDPKGMKFESDLCFKCCRDKDI